MKKPKFNKRPIIKVSDSLKWFFAPISIVLISSLLLLYKLFSLMPYMTREFAVNLGSANLDLIKNDIAYAPIKILQLALLKFTDDDSYIRLASVIVAVTAGLLLFMFLRRWQTNRISVMTSLLFVASTYFLQLGRSANHEVYYLSIIPAILLGFMWLISGKESPKLPLVALAFGLALYAPGSIIFLLAGFIFLRKVIIKSLKTANKLFVSVGSLLFVATIAPLVASFVLNPGQITHWIGVNSETILDFKAMGQRALSIPNELFFNGINDPLIWLHRTPILDIFMITMLILGIYAYRAGYYPTREKLVLGSAIIALLLIVLGGVISIALLIPIVFIIISNGISYMLQSWFAVFPKNPVARPLGLIMISLLVAGSCFYQLQRYFVAWPNAEPTVNSITTDGSSDTIKEEETINE